MYKGNVYELVDKIAAETGVSLYLIKAFMVGCKVASGWEFVKNLTDNDELEKEIRDFAESCKEMIASPPQWKKNELGHVTIDIPGYGEQKL